MLQIISKLFGGSKSEKDVKKIQHLVAVINGHFEGYKALTIVTGKQIGRAHV